MSPCQGKPFQTLSRLLLTFPSRVVEGVVSVRVGGEYRPQVPLLIKLIPPLPFLLSQEEVTDMVVLVIEEVGVELLHCMVIPLVQIMVKDPMVMMKGHKVIGKEKFPNPLLGLGMHLGNLL